MIYPVFIGDGENQKIDISSMPGQYRMSLDLFEDEVGKIAESGIRSILLFGVPDQKDSCASEAMKSNGLIQRAVQVAKKVAPQLVVMTDVCVCEFTDHGHCGIIEDGDVLNDPSLDLLTQMAVSHAQAGADIVAPSAMMDGQVAAIRHALDNEGFDHLPIMAYAAKFSSKFYGPFREAANSAPQFGDRKSYQMDPANLREARREIISDAEQGGDIIMVKPGLAYLDVLAMARATVDQPIAVYNVSGEYSMVKAAAANGWIDEKEVALEILTAFKRAGADLIITYFARDVANWLK
jgi:porphobilinogen synthase